ncbi:TPA: RelA/SpoT domain-containing protein [Morganella morganii]|nr:RelA/SpoT domain-containing protein [Morganella morganii]
MSKNNDISDMDGVEGLDSQVVNTIVEEYEYFYNKGNYFLSQIKEQISKLLDEINVTLGVPIESRVKDKISILNKIARKGQSPEHINELTDFLGLRIILLFKKDLIKVVDCIKSNFKVITFDDKSCDVDVERFGYQSIHFIVKTPDSWNLTPTLSDGELFKIEIQIRTLSQHIWAAASHKLQYKTEENIPPLLRRNIHRISAILEMVDLEFDRVLYDRDKYIAMLEDSADNPSVDNSNLDIEILKVISKKYLPQDYLSSDNGYSELLTELKKNQITTMEELISIIKNNYDEVHEDDVKSANDEIMKKEAVEGKIKDRWYRGRYFNDVGLIRKCVRNEFLKNEKEYKQLKSYILKK